MKIHNREAIVRSMNIALSKKIKGSHQETNLSSKNDKSDFFKPFVQAKLMINQPGDFYEQEADAIAEKVMGTSPSQSAAPFFQPNPVAITQVQRKCAACEQEEKEVQRKASSPGVLGGAAPTTVNNVIGLSGQSMDKRTSGFMESRFGYDFSKVQIHNDPMAHRSAAEINALAYTHGNHVVFASGQYQPGTTQGKELLAHELTHVVQQGTRPGLIQLKGNGKINGDITVSWIDRDDEFFRRTVAAISSKFNVPESKLFAPVNSPAQRIYSKLAGKSLKKGASVKLHVNFSYDKNNPISSVELSIPGEETISAGKQGPSCAMLPAPSSLESRADRSKEASFYARWFSLQAESADRGGAEGIIFHVSYNGQEMTPGFERIKGGIASESFRSHNSCAWIEAEHMKPFFDGILIAIQSFQPGKIFSWDITLKRNQRGQMDFVKSEGHYEDIKKARVKTEREELDELGIPDRKKIYGGIMKRWEKEVKAAGMMVLTFGIEQLVYWYVGGFVFDLFGMIGGTIARTAFPRIAALLRLRSAAGAAALGRGMQVLSEAEQVEFASLLSKVESKTALEGAELSRARELFTKVESSLPVAQAPGRGLLHLAESAGVRAEIEEGRIAVYLHGTTDEAAAKMIGDPGSFLTASGGKFGGKFYAAENVSTAEVFAKRAVSGSTSTPTIVGIAMEQETADYLVQRQLAKRVPIDDMPGLYQMVFQPGAIETLNEQGYFFLVITP